LLTDEPLLLSAEEAARLCGIAARTWWRLHSAGRVPMPLKLGRATRWSRSELQAWVKVGCPARDKWGSAKETAKEVK